MTAKKKTTTKGAREGKAEGRSPLDEMPPRFFRSAGLTRNQYERLMRRQLDAQNHKIRGKQERQRERRKRLSPAMLPLPGWGERRMTLRDFREACERERIVVLRLPLPGRIRGFYVLMRGIPTIWIDWQLKGTPLLTVLFHELGHHFMHRGEVPPLRLADAEPKGVADWREVEADAAANIALRPKARISKLLREALPVMRWIMREDGAGKKRGARR